MTALWVAVEWLEAELRHNTPNADHARALLAKLDELIAADDDAALVMELEREVAELEARIDELEATLG